jgi:serine/threonine protein kinase/WD40 repeat protein
MEPAASERDPFEQLAESFLNRYRAGERPAINDYAHEHPELADQIRQLFPALIAMEGLRPAIGELHAGAAAQSEIDQIPHQLGDYRILRELGRGGMGIVYEAVQESLGRHVALKVLLFTSLTNPKHLDRFRREAQAAARLHHTNIVPVFGVGEHEGTHYYAMQFIQGQSLDTVLGEVRRLRKGDELSANPTSAHSLASSAAEGLLTDHFANRCVNALQQAPPGSGTSRGSTVDEPRSSNDAGLSTSSELLTRSDSQYFRGVARLGVQLAEALEYAHGQGVLHRDIKPSNLLLDTEGRIWITDFGLAKVDDSDELTHPGDVVGTLRYMAPERFHSPASPASDVYGLGITLYELVTLRPAFLDSNRVHLMDRVAHSEPAAPRKLDQRIPRDLETIIVKAMAKEPLDRYASAKAVGEDLRRFVADRPIRARRSAPLERIIRLCRRNPVITTLTASVFLLLITVAMVSSLAAVRLQRAEREKTEKLWQSYLAQAQALRWSGRVGQRCESLAKVTEAARIARSLGVVPANILEMRNQAIASLTLSDLGLEHAIAVSPASYYGIDLDDQFHHYAWSDSRAVVHVQRVNDSARIARLESPVSGVLANVRYSRDGRWLAIGYGRPEEEDVRIDLWECDDSGKPVRLVSRQTPDSLHFDVSADNRFFAYICHHKNVHVVELSSDREIKTLKMKPGQRPHTVRFHPRKKALAITMADDRQVHVFDFATGVETTTIALPSRPDGLAWGRDDKRVAIGCDDQQVYIYDFAEGRFHTVIEGHRQRAIQLYYGPDAEFLVSTAWDSTCHLWDPVTGRQLVNGEGYVLRLDGECSRAALYFPDRLEIRRIAGFRECRTIHHSMAGNRLPRPEELSPKSVHYSAYYPGLLASSGLDGVKLWNTRRADAELAHLPVGFCWTALFHPSQDALLTYARQTGLCLWPLRVDRSTDTLYIGPPRAVKLNTGCRFVGWADRSGLLSVVDPPHERAVVLSPQIPTTARILGPHPALNNAAFSPDGIWAATSTWSGSQIRIWNTESGNLAKVIECKAGLGRFSPDGRWLVTMATEQQPCFWHVGTWTMSHAATKKIASPAELAFSPDGTIMALDDWPRGIKLLKTQTGEELGTLEAPDDNASTSLTFSSDGAQVAAATPNHTIHLWDLRSIRRELAGIGLDWDLPPFPAAANEPPLPNHVQVLLGDLLGPVPALGGR